MKIEYSLLTGKIYVRKSNKEKIDLTDEIITSVQIMLHNNIEFNKLYSKLDNKTFKLKLEEIKD
jgi:hypothetical protein